MMVFSKYATMAINLYHNVVKVFFAFSYKKNILKIEIYNPEKTLTKNALTFIFSYFCLEQT